MSPTACRRCSSVGRPPRATSRPGSSGSGRPARDEVFDLVEEIRSQGPLYRSRIGYVTTSHAAVRHVLTSDDFRTGLPTAQGALGRISRWAAPTTLHPVEPPSLLVTEPPDHTRYRKLVTRVFTMRAVERLRERTEEIAADLLDSLEKRASGPVDLVETYCSVLPVTVIAEILGVPEEERAQVLAFGAAAAPSLDLGLGLPALPVRRPGARAVRRLARPATSRRCAVPPATTCSASWSPSARRAAGWTRPS